MLYGSIRMLQTSRDDPYSGDVWRPGEFMQVSLSTDFSSSFEPSPKDMILDFFNPDKMAAGGEAAELQTKAAVVIQLCRAHRKNKLPHDITAASTHVDRGTRPSRGITVQ